ncbi:MAG: response regulator transcription factor [Lachnospiraceae bacterium]|nr:response regulator transcription factor [Lachnospiraceae bacterium]
MTEKQTILVVDDEARMRKLVRDFLIKNDFSVIEASDGEEALDIFFEKQSQISLVVLDVMMPKRDGYDVCREIRQYDRSVPIIMLTAKGEERDELQGFSAGADEYLAKPFSPKILVARIEAILRRTGAGTENEVIEAAGIRLDHAAHTVTIDGTPVDLSFKEFELLHYFLENRGIALSREKILNHVWNYDYFGDARTIDTHVKKLRSKMGAAGEMIRTVWGVGYKFDP